LTIIGCSAIVGAIARYIVQSVFNISFVKLYGTLIVNTAGCSTAKC